MVNIQPDNGVELTESIAMGQEQIVSIPGGKNRLTLDCRTSREGVFSLSHMGITSVEFLIDDTPAQRLVSNQISYITPHNSFHAHITLNKEFTSKVRLNWLPTPEFIALNQKTSFIVSLFYGLCFTLALYVLILGRHLKDLRFHHYSLYMFSIMMFFLLQEGQLNFFLPINWGQNSLITLMFFAGSTVFLASRFLVRLLDLNQLWPRLTFYFVQLPARVVISLTLILFISNEYWFNELGSIIAWLTLFIIVGCLYLVGRAALNRVHTANIVFLALCVLLMAMIPRIVFPDMDIFIRQYALFFSVTLESFLLAIATSEKIKLINTEGMAAKKEAITDQLCGVLNRRGWIINAEKVLDSHRNDGGYLIVFYIDINNFKQINDYYGHHVGDEVLQAISKLIKHQVKESDPVGRIGGDEFVVMCHFNNKKNSEKMLNRLKGRLEKSIIQTSVGVIEISSSIGAQEYTQAPSGIEQVLKETDQIMYKHKLTFKQENP